MESPQKEDVDALKDEIAAMKAEALRRMQALKSELAEANTTPAAVSTPPEAVPPQVKSVSETATKVEAARKEEKDRDFAPRVAVSNATRKETTFSPMQTQVNNFSLLDGTRWKVMLNIGREPSTWMPKTWGASGERLLLNAEVEFTSEQLYEREEFLNGITHAKKMQVHSVALGPTMTEDSRPLRIKDSGGWRVDPGEGPMRTDVLRFYLEIEEDARHQGGDVYCPKGRVYCTCGYFPIHQTSGLRDELQKQHMSLTDRYEDLSAEMETASVWDKLKLGKQMLNVRMELGKVEQQLQEARVKEPEKSLLRLSRKRDVGLTKEGGVCCKVVKGFAVEYHILGKFGLASIEKREEMKEQKLKP
jgi:hypothetical protein